MCHGKTEQPEASSQHADQPPEGRSFPEKVWKQSHHPLLPLLSIEELWDGKPFEKGQLPIYYPPKDKVQRGVMAGQARGVRCKLGLPHPPGEPETAKDELLMTHFRDAPEREYCLIRMMDILEHVWRSKDYRWRQIKILREREEERVRDGKRM